MIEYRYLRAFMSTAKHLSFSKAAEDLNIAQSAVSRQVKLLEEVLGVELIIRSSKKVVLTNKGKDFFVASQRFEEDASFIFQSTDKPIVKVGILHGLLENWFLPILQRYKKLAKRKVILKVDRPEVLLKMLEEGQLDVIISTDHVQSELISSLKLFDEKLVLISKNPVNKKDISHLPWIVYSDNDHLYKLSKITPNDIVEIPSMTSIVNLVKMGAGVAVVPEHTLKKTDKLILTDLSKIEKSTVFMTSLNYKHLPKFLEDLQKAMKID